MPVENPIVVYKLQDNTRLKEAMLKDLFSREPDGEWGSLRTREQQEDQWTDSMEERNEPTDLDRPEQGMDQLWPK